MKKLTTPPCGPIEVTRFSAHDLNAVTEAGDPAQAFLRSGWFAAGSEISEIVGATRANGELLAAFPLTTRKLGPLRINEIAGVYWPYKSIPVAAEVSDAELTAFLTHPEMRTALGRNWRFGPVYADDPVAMRTLKLAQDAGWHVLKRPLGTCFELDLAALHAAGPWPKGSTRRKNNARERKMADIGALEYAHFIGDEWTDRYRDAIAEVEAHCWLAKLDGGGDTKFLDPERRRIWDALALDPALSSMLFGSLLFIGERPVAFTFGLEVGIVRYYIANNYDEEFSRQGPGKILLYKDFVQAFERGIEKISWGAGDAGYKSEMGAEPGPEILDLLFVRGGLLAAALRPFFERKPEAA